MAAANILTISYEQVIHIASETETAKAESNPDNTADTQYFERDYAFQDEVRKPVRPQSEYGWDLLRFE